HESILSFRTQDIDENGKRGTLIFTSASVPLRGGSMTSAFSVGKFVVRSLSQSLGKEFGKDNIHIRGLAVIAQDATRKLNGEDWANNANARLDPQSIAKVGHSVRSGGATKSCKSVYVSGRTG
ncbi:hypothetical protein K488DRAFT_60457, partial [Vararia minispora EC-137]